MDLAASEASARPRASEKYLGRVSARAKVRGRARS